jgi:hypothetical protein
VAAPGGQGGLRQPAPAATEHAPHRQPEAAGEVVGLVEAALECPPGVERHRHDGVGAGQQVPAGLTHQAGQGAGQGATPAELEDMHDLAERALVRTDAPRHHECRRLARAAPAGRAAPGIRPEGLAAPHARRRRHWSH